MELNEITKSDAKALRRNAQDARTKSDKAQWEQSVALHTIYYSGYSVGEDLVSPIYELWGYDDWFSYVEGEIGIHVGKANRLVATAHFFMVKMDKHWNKQVLSPTRMRTLSTAKQVTTSNLNAWITKARNMTPCELDHQLLGHAHGTRSMGFKFAEKDRDLIRNQLQLIKEVEGFATLGDALLSMFKKRKGLKVA